MKQTRSPDHSFGNSFGSFSSIYVLRIKVVIALMLFIGLIYGIEHYIGWFGILSDWEQLNVTSIISLTILVFLSHLLRIVRVYFVYNLTQKVAFIDVSAVSLLHNTISFLLPMHIGEAALPLLSRKQLHVNAGYATATLFVIRSFDLHVLLILLLFFTGSLFTKEYPLWVPFMGLFVLPLGVETLKKLAHKFTFFAPIRPLLTPYSVWIKVYMFTLAIWGIKLSALTFLAQQLAHLALDHAWIATIMADGSALSPVTGIANAGTFEAAFSLPLLSLGYRASDILRIAVNVHIFVFVTNLIAGIIGFILLRHTKTLNS